MKKKRVFVGWVLLLGILVISNTLMVADSYDDDVRSKCGSGCKQRCSQAGVQDRCLKYCGICCAKCNCVPSGTYGNKHQCPCYRDMVNSKGKPKCP